MTTFLDTPIKLFIIKWLYYNNTASINELSGASNKSIPIVSKAVSALVESKILETTSQAPSTGGRKASRYYIMTGCLFVLSVAMDQLYTTISTVDISNNQPHYYKRFHIALSDHGKTLEHLIESINEVLDASKIERNQYLGIGLGMPGFINTKTGHNQTYALTPNQVGIRDYLQKVFQMRVELDNDSSTIALGESKFGLAKGKDNAMVVNISWGVGLGMIIDGKMFRGNAGYAGEFSHIPIAENEILCTCGKKGCLETVATLRTVTQQATEAIAHGTLTNIHIKNHSTEELAYAIMHEANKGDQLCIELISDMAYKIGKALAILIHIINPEQILLSGRASEVGKLLLAPIQQALNKYCIPRLMDSVELSASNLKYKAYTIGATALVVEHL